MTDRTYGFKPEDVGNTVSAEWWGYLKGRRLIVGMEVMGVEMMSQTQITRGDTEKYIMSLLDTLDPQVEGWYVIRSVDPTSAPGQGLSQDADSPQCTSPSRSPQSQSPL